MRIGVVGYSAQNFDKTKAESILQQAFFKVLPEGGVEPVQVVSGLTDLGIPSVAYRIAKRAGWQTTGIACRKAYDYDCFPCDWLRQAPKDRIHIIGENWGDESETFLAAIDVLIRVGGGKQSHAECARAKELGIWVIEEELEVIAA